MTTQLLHDQNIRWIDMRRAANNLVGKKALPIPEKKMEKTCWGGIHPPPPPTPLAIGGLKHARAAKWCSIRGNTGDLAIS